MKTVKEVSRLTGISVRTLHHYDSIGLLKPTAHTESGYRLYDDSAIEKLYLILVYRELGFTLKEIAKILDAPDYDRNRVLEQQIKLLEAKVTHLKNRIQFARGISFMGVKNMDFTGFDPKKIDEYSAQAEALYGKTDAYKEFQEKNKNRSKEDNKVLGDGVMELFSQLGKLRDNSPDSEIVQDWVKHLQQFITENFYNCTPEILKGLGEMYAGGGSMTENIDAVGGHGTGDFAKSAINIYCDAQKNI